MKIVRASIAFIVVALAVPIPHLRAETINIVADGIHIPCEIASGGATTSVCFEQAYWRVDKEMGTAYEKTANAIVAPSKKNEVDYRKVRATFIDAQKAWLEFRDKSCAMVFEMYPGDPAYKARNTLCLIKMTNSRIEQIENISKQLKTSH